MKTRGSGMCVSLLLSGLLLWGPTAARVSGEAGKRSAASHAVVLKLKISDRHSGLILDAKRSVPRGANAFQILQEIVAVKYKTYPDLGVFVTGLCGIDAPEGKVWTFKVDSKWSTVGIGRLTLERDVMIEWTTR